MQGNYKDSSSLERSKMNLEIRRNIYDQKGKDLSADVPSKTQTNGNGEDKSEENAASGGLTEKQLEEIAKEPRKPVYCESCGIDCSRISFHFIKPVPADAKPPVRDICPACFGDHRFPSSTEAKDYVKRDDPTFSSIPDKDNAWTDSEVLLLLEGLEKFDDNWNQTADHVGTRSREECVVKFLQLEIEDQYQEADVSGPNYSGLEAGRFPFAQGDNPVLSVLGYLAGLSEPSVVAAAGGRAIAEQSKRTRQRLENGIGGDASKESPGKAQKSKEPLKSEDAMEVDDTTTTHAAAPAPTSTSTTTSDPAPAATTTITTSTALTTIPDGPTPAPLQPPRDQMTDVANLAFAAGAARASALASHEEREMTRLVSATVNSTLQKLDFKLKHFNLLEAALQQERRELERGRQQLFLDRMAFRKKVIETQDQFRAAAQEARERGAEAAEKKASAVTVDGASVDGTAGVGVGPAATNSAAATGSEGTRMAFVSETATAAAGGANGAAGVETLPSLGEAAAATAAAGAGAGGQAEGGAFSAYEI